MITLKSILDETVGMAFVLEKIESTLLRRFGALKGYRNSPVNQPLAKHIYACFDEEFLDVIEIVFRVPGCGGYHRGVTACNEIFDQECIGYELTPFVIDQPPRLPGTPLSGLHGDSPSITTFPQVIRKSEKVLHAGTIEPALQVLSDPRFATANSELVGGLVKLRKGEYQESIQACGSAIETVLKTICTVKKWPYTEHKDTLTDLTLICQSQGLFFPFLQTHPRRYWHHAEQAQCSWQRPEPRFHSDKRPRRAHGLFLLCERGLLDLAGQTVKFAIRGHSKPSAETPSADIDR
jgi:hypothetical protein